MSDTEIIDWLQHHLMSLHLEAENPEVYSIEWLDEKAYVHKSKGSSLRDCVCGAVLGDRK